MVILVTITVYREPDCAECDATHLALQKSGLAYEVVDITRDAIARDYIRSLGHPEAPVVVAGPEHWSGHRPDRIRALVVRTAAAVA
jgi:glutaredoxin-like protein NrdH